MEKKNNSGYHLFAFDREEIFSLLSKEQWIQILENLFLIRQFETRAEGAYLQGKIGGFFHSYIGQEAIQTAAVAALGKENWWITSYRCHALALLLGATPDELMAELYGRSTGNARGRGGSMHFYTRRLLGGFGIVGGQIPIATGAAFTAKYLQSGEVAVCFLGDGAVAQGAFHESLNIAALWDLPCIYVIENNQWGMGTAVKRAISVEPIAEQKAPGYGMKGYTFDGMDFLNCYAGFAHVYKEIKRDSKPVLIEVKTERFKGHSISDPGLYRSKETLNACLQKDSLFTIRKELQERGLFTERELEALEKEQKEKVLAALKFAEESPWPDPICLEEDVFAP